MVPAWLHVGRPVGVTPVGVDGRDICDSVLQKIKRERERPRILIRDATQKPLPATPSDNGHVVADRTIEHAALVPVAGHRTDECKGWVVLVVLDEICCHLKRAFQDDIERELLRQRCVNPVVWFVLVECEVEYPLIFEKFQYVEY